MAGGFKVGIVGGGMTGLIAALTLDRVGIDFILLEAYPEINPEVGASLALYPNYQRVLDQLGVLGDVQEASAEMSYLKCHDVNGKLMFDHNVKEPIHKATGGYGIRTFTRSQLLKILYQNLSKEGKANVHASQRVSRIEELSGDQGVRLHMEGGHSYDVDMVIGADGTHSIVRSEMWRLAQEKDPKAFAGDQLEGEKHSLPARMRP
jgi:2-polyprenyl-6-methoxyphenol hydroxylase-like FAD-dependent oxidoreductase